MSQRKLILSMQITLDGYVAGPNDSVDWLLSDDEEWREHFKDTESADTFLLGRKMYPSYSQHWQGVLQNPHSDPNELQFAKFADRAQHIVFTKGDFKPDWKNTRVAHDLPGEVARLKKENGKNIIAWGGACFAASLIDLGLVDEYRFELNPHILAKGKRLFDTVELQQKLILIDSKPLKSGLIVLKYRPQGESKKAGAQGKSLLAESYV